MSLHDHEPTPSRLAEPRYKVLVALLVSCPRFCFLLRPELRRKALHQSSLRPAGCPAGFDPVGVGAGFARWLSKLTPSGFVVVVWAGFVLLGRGVNFVAWPSRCASSCSLSKLTQASFVVGVGFVCFFLRCFVRLFVGACFWFCCRAGFIDFLSGASSGFLSGASSGSVVGFWLCPLGAELREHEGTCCLSSSGDAIEPPSLKHRCRTHGGAVGLRRRRSFFVIGAVALSPDLELTLAILHSFSSRGGYHPSG